MPITSAARLASLASSSVQRPRAPVRYERGFMDSARWTPVTSWPASAALAAATAESTPPDMAASTRSRSTATRVFARGPARAPGFLITEDPVGQGAQIFRDHGRRAPCGVVWRLAGGGAAGALYCLADSRTEGVHVLLGRGVPEREPQRAAGPGVVRAHREQHMAWLRHARRAGRAGGAGD